MFGNCLLLLQGISFLGPAACLAGCAVITPHGAKHAAGILSKQATGVIVGLLSISFALGAWARGGLYCNHQVMALKTGTSLYGLTRGSLSQQAYGILLWLLHNATCESIPNRECRASLPGCSETDVASGSGSGIQVKVTRS